MPESSAADRTPRRAASRHDGLSRAAVEGAHWVSLARACELLGVNESTVRRWADAGQIQCFRTPGGHRRFAEADLHALLEGRTGQGQHDLESAALSRIHRRLTTRGPDWYADYGTSERDQLRPLGRRLVELVGDYLARRRRRSEVEEEVDAIGRQYGQVLAERRTTLVHALEAFTFFRRSLDEAAKQLAERNRMTAEDALRAREEIAGLADRVLLGLAEAYEPA